ncbi:hypothetical protein I3842_07G084600 [Carya illinoinensis]|uniref:Uncharacterized protein n=1 Tax=Carya illinoinensis TaxID=32201 RepID=A0A922EJX7_CARIL|nr:hypothetical protein I3842_07G084600 [Carya illinoinensis]
MFQTHRISLFVAFFIFCNFCNCSVKFLWENLGILWASNGFNFSMDFSKHNGEDGEEELNVVIEVDRPTNVHVGSDIQEKASSLKARTLNFESSSKIVGLSNEIEA